MKTVSIEHGAKSKYSYCKTIGLQNDITVIGDSEVICIQKCCEKIKKPELLDVKLDPKTESLLKEIERLKKFA